MRKLIAISMLMMTLFVSSLFAPITESKVEKQAVALRDMYEKQKRILVEKQSTLKEDETRKAQEEQEARALQKKLDELKAQEEVRQQEEIHIKAAQEAASKKLKEEQAAQTKTDGIKRLKEAFDDLLVIQTKYAALDKLSATQDQQKYAAAYMKEIKVLLEHTGQLLKGLSNDEVKEAIIAMNISPDRGFDLLYNLADVSAMSDITSALGTTLEYCMTVVLDSLSESTLVQYLTNKQIEGQLIHSATKLMRIVQSPRKGVVLERLTAPEELFMAMINFTSKLVEILGKAQPNQRPVIARILLNWVRQIPVTPTSQDHLLAALKDLKIESLPMDHHALRDWYLAFRSSKNQQFVRTLIQRYLQALYANGTMPAFRDGIRILGSAIPAAEIVNLQKTALTAAAHKSMLQAMRDEDIDWVINTLKEYTEQRGPDVDAIWLAMEDELDAAIAATKEAKQSNRYKTLQDMKRRMSDMLFEPAWTSKVSAAVLGKARSDKQYEPNFKAWSPQHVKRYLLNISDTNYRDGIFTTPEALFDSICTYGRALRWYADFTDLSNVLFDVAKKYYAPKTFEIADSDAHFGSELFDLIKQADVATGNLFMSTLDYLWITNRISKKALAAIEDKLFDSIFNGPYDGQYEDYVHKVSPLMLKTFAMSGHFTGNERTVQFLNALTDQQFTAFAEGLKSIFGTPVDAAVVNGLIQAARLINPQRARIMLQSIKNLDFHLSGTARKALNAEIERRIQEEQAVQI